MTLLSCVALWACSDPEGDIAQSPPEQPGATAHLPNPAPKTAPDPGASPAAAATISLARTLPQSTVEQLRALHDAKREWSGYERKLSSQLLLAARRNTAQVRALPTLRSTVQLGATGTVLVDIQAAVDPALLEQIRALGGDITASVPEFDAVQARLPLQALEPLAKKDSVRSIRPALGMTTNKVDTSQGDVAHHADVIRSQQGVDGSGVTICVLSDGVDSLADRQATGDLPAVTVLAGQAGSGDEGTAMLEIVHDLAPGAALQFATAFPSQARFAANILLLRQGGCDILVDDVSYFSEASFQDDILAQTIDAVVADGGLYFSAAGNGGAKQSGTGGVYEGDYAATTPVPSAVLGANPDYDSVHDFGGGVLGDTITRDAPYLFTLEWSDPLAASANDYDLFLLSSDLSTVIDASILPQSGSEDAFEYIDSATDDDKDEVLLIALWNGSPERHVRLNTHRGRLALNTPGQLSGHPAAEGAFAIGAVDVGEAMGGLFSESNGVETFSSDGPRRMFFDAAGNELTPGNLLASGGVLRDKPDFTAADGVSTSTPGFSPFYGTSAAAPHAAALAALVLEARPDIRAQAGSYVASAMRSALLAGAIDIESQGFDSSTGFGTLMADSVLGPCAGVVCTAQDDCHDVGVCDTDTGQCSNPIKADDSVCDDGDRCTQSDTCQSGTCIGTDPVVCQPSDQCHSAGSCDSATGSCSDPIVPDGTGCNDLDACTQADSCQAGTCVGADPVTCAASDQCHAVGSCDPATGTCSDPIAPNGSGCSDGDACTLVDTCQAGTCVGAAKVVCTALDQCHTAGVCSPSTGLCDNPHQPDGTGCDDGNACTSTDSCRAGTCTGADPVVCTASDQCHVAGTCDPATGTCSDPNQSDGTSCDDGNACTRRDSCESGVCAGTDPVVCTALDQCHLAGSCDPATGTCDDPNQPDGSACDDGNACTRSDACSAGSCTGSDALACTALDACHLAGVCDPGSGACTNPLATSEPDTDGDGTCDWVDPDDDGDGALDQDDLYPTDPKRCHDYDADGCDDCSRVAPPDPNDDGPDYDGDGVCDTSDPPPDPPALPDAGAPPGDAGPNPGDAGLDPGDAGDGGTLGTASPGSQEPSPSEPQNPGTKNTPSAEAGAPSNTSSKPNQPAPSSLPDAFDAGVFPAPSSTTIPSWLTDELPFDADGGTLTVKVKPGCNCRVPSAPRRSNAFAILALLGLVALRRAAPRRRRRG